MNYREQIKHHEGFRFTVYKCSSGVLTVGWGHAFLGPRTPKVGDEYPAWKLTEFFEDDMQNVERDYLFLEKEFNLRGLDYIRRAVLKNMLFNLGLPKLLRFKKMFRALEQGDFILAGLEMLDSKWASQVGSRATILTVMMKQGKKHHLAKVA